MDLAILAEDLTAERAVVLTKVPVVLQHYDVLQVLALRVAVLLDGNGVGGVSWLLKSKQTSLSYTKSNKVTGWKRVTLFQVFPSKQVCLAVPGSSVRLPSRLEVNTQGQLARNLI